MGRLRPFQGVWGRGMPPPVSKINNMKKLLIAFIALIGASAAAQDKTLPIEAKGNSYKTAEGTTSFYFRTDSLGTIDLTLVGKGAGKVAVEAEGKKFTAQFKGAELDSVQLGAIKIAKKGYVRVDVKAPDGFTPERLRVGGAVSPATLSYVHGFSPYWGSRGPSVHLKYTMPAEPTRWFYNEVTVPEGQDVVGSYYMAGGFGEGYFGMQCNSADERRVLFSVWSPFVTDDPKSIPAEDQIKMLRRGEGVHIGEFGNEGSGGQSFLRYPWKAGNTYRFLASVEPDGKGATVYTAYFYAPEEGAWRLIASFLRPKTDKNYTNAHSFLENFIPTQGYLTRKVDFGNQWAMGVDGVWRELTEATFTYDATAAAGVRKDYAGGTTPEGQFFLKNCGFFDLNTPYRSVHTRPATGAAPQIDFEALKLL